MKYRAHLLLLLLIFPSTLIAKTFFGISTPLLYSKVNYSDADVSDVELSYKSGLFDESNLGFEIMVGDFERGRKWRWGGEVRNINLEGQSGTTKYLFESREYLVKIEGIAAEAERAWRVGFIANLFAGLGTLNYQFSKIDENRTSEIAEKADEFNYTQIGSEVGMEVYITNSFFISGTIRNSLNENGIKIKYLPNPDGSESTGTFKNLSSFNVTLGFYF